MRAIRQKAQRTKHKVQSADLCYLERKERFELSKRVWKTRMFPATSLPRVIAAHRQLESAIGNVGTPGRIRTRNLDVRSVALFQLSYRSKEFGHGASYRIRTGVSALATPCLKPTGPTMREECLELCTLIIGLDDACYQRMQSSKHKEQRSFLFFFGRGGQN